MIDKDEVLRTRSPDPEKIKCKTCRHKTPSIKVGERLVDRFTFGNCDAYPYPGNKPHAVLWDGGDCPHYKQEKTPLKINFQRKVIPYDRVEEND